MIINSEETNQKAIDRVFKLIENYDANIDKINQLVSKIEHYEDTAPEFEEFNKNIKIKTLKK